MIKTVIFDLGGVIVPFDFKRAYARLAPLCKYPVAEIPVRLRTTDLVTRFECGHIEPRAFVEQFCSLLEINTSYEQFRDLWTSIFLPNTLIPDSFFANLREQRRIILLSNTNAIHFEMIQEQYPLIRHFHDTVLSYKVGALKPQREIYEAALKAAHCRPEECFFTDDIAVNIDAAREVGIEGVQFHSFDQLQAAFRERGIID